MLDHQDGAALAHPADQLHDAIHILMRHARSRLVEQHHFWRQRQRGGDLQGPLATIGELDRLDAPVTGQADILQQGARLVVELVQGRLGAPEIVGVPTPALQRHPDVLERGQMREHGGDLEAAYQAEPRHLRRALAGDVLTHEPDGSARRLHELGQHVEAGRLAGAVGSDQRVDRPGLHLQIDRIDRHEAAEFSRQIPSFENYVGHLDDFPAPLAWLLCISRATVQDCLGEARGATGQREPARVSPDVTYRRHAPVEMPRIRRLRLAALWLAVTAPLAACNLGPDYARPGSVFPAAWRGAATTDAQAWPSGDWWRGFRSPQLDALMTLARAQNLDIVAAIARVRQADAQVRIAGAPLLPTVGVGGGASYERIGSTGSRGRFGAVTTGTGAVIATSGSGRYRDLRQYNVTGDISYEADFWGRNAAVLESAKASAMFSRFDREVVALTVLTNVATAWFTALDLADRLAIAKQNLADAERTLAVIQARLTVGTATALDLAQQQALVQGERAIVPGLRNQLEQELTGLGILVGRPPEEISVRPGTLVDLALPAVYPGLPSELLARRPDVAAAEAELVAANADIKAARAAFFPVIQLTGSGGYQSLALSTLLGPGAALISLAANASQPIFDAGTLRGRLELARGRRDELVANYRRAILQAFTDVENALTALRFTADQQALQEQAVATAQRAADIARAQVAAGTVDVITVLTAQSTLYSAQDTLAQVRLLRFQALLNLYKALGGGWSQPEVSIPAQFPGLSPGRVGGGFALPVGDNVK